MKVRRGRGRWASSARFRARMRHRALPPLMHTREQLADLDSVAAVRTAAARIVPRSPAQLSAAGAIARHKRAVAAVGVCLALAGALVGVLRSPTYTASSTLQVGTVNFNSPSFYGFVQSASDLATVFSRSIAAGPVLLRIQHRLGIKPAAALARLSAEPIPISPSFRIIATGPTALAAVRLANAASHAVIAYTARSAAKLSPQSASLLAEYHAAAQAAQKASAAVVALAKAAVPGEDPRMIRARSTLDADRVRASALGAAYQSVLVSVGANPSNRPLSMVAGAVTASSDRQAKIELLAFIGLLAGLVVGGSLAVAREQRRAHPGR